MKYVWISFVFLSIWPPSLLSAEIVGHPAAWHSQFESGRYCQVTTGSFGIDTSDLPIGAAGFFSLRFYHSVHSPGHYWFERLGYQEGSTFLALNVSLKKENLSTPLHAFLPLTASINGIDLVGVHEEFPFELTVGAPNLNEIVLGLHRKAIIEVDVSTNTGERYSYQVMSHDFTVAWAMFEACIDAMRRLQ